MSTTTHAAPHVQPFALGDFQTNCMIVTSGEPAPGASCWIVDCGFTPDPLLDAVREQDLRVEKIVLTHAHSDHIAGLTRARSLFPEAPIVMHELERDWLADPMLNLSAAMGLEITAPSADAFIAHGDTLGIGAVAFRIAHVPGHSPGSVALIHEPSRTAIVGDTLFSGSIGRTDLPGGDFDTLERSIREHLYTLDPETVCYPGHGPSTTIGRELATNPFVRA